MFGASGFDLPGNIGVMKASFFEHILLLLGLRLAIAFCILGGNIKDLRVIRTLLDELDHLARRVDELSAFPEDMTTSQASVVSDARHARHR